MALTFDDEKMEIYPTLQDLEAAVFEILNTITNTLQVRLCVIAIFHEKMYFELVLISMTLIHRKYRRSSHGWQKPPLRL